MPSSGEAYCRRVVHEAGSNFTPAFRFLDREQVRAMRALYALCRVVDDVVDSQFTVAVKRRQLAFWRDQLCLEALSDSGHPLLEELWWTLQHFGLPIEYLQQLIAGVAMDVEPTTYADWPALEHYCYGVAGTVGLCCLRIFRVVETETTRRAAVALANAFQLTNILRDVREDLANGRRYLPVADLTAHGLDWAALERIDVLEQHGAAVRTLMHFEINRAAGFFADAWHGFPQDERRALRPALLMSDYYGMILQRISHDPLRVWRERLRLPMRTKVWLLLRRSFSAEALPAWQPRSA